MGRPRRNYLPGEITEPETPAAPVPVGLEPEADVMLAELSAKADYLERRIAATEGDIYKLKRATGVR